MFLDSIVKALKNNKNYFSAITMNIKLIYSFMYRLPAFLESIFGHGLIVPYVLDKQSVIILRKLKTRVYSRNAVTCLMAEKPFVLNSKRNLIAGFFHRINHITVIISFGVRDRANLYAREIFEYLL